MEKEVINVGFTGPMGSGKGTAIEELHNSLSHIVRAEATERDIEHTRENLISLGKYLRSKYGDEVLGVRTAEKLNSQKYAFEIADGIRDPAEVRALREKLENFVLIAITAEDETRYQRVLSRQRPSDIKGLEEFNEEEKLKEIREKDLYDRSLGIDESVRMADYRINNNDINEQELRSRVREAIDDYISKLETSS